MSVELILGDCFEVMKGMPDKSVDAVITDPPYGLNVDTWDKYINPETFMKEVSRISKDYFVFFGMMPMMALWHTEAIKHFDYREHVVWVKRVLTQSARLMRGHESILIYSKESSKFYNTKGHYSDIQLPKLASGLISIESIDRYISDLHYRLKNGKDAARIEHKGTQHPVYRSRFEKGRKYSRSPDIMNYTNVWSFLPESQASHNNDGEYTHPTIKPTKLLDRLIRVVTEREHTVLDPFMGSGSTGVACVQTGRNFIGIEIDETYFRIAERRIKEAQMQPRLL